MKPPKRSGMLMLRFSTLQMRQPESDREMACPGLFWCKMADIIQSWYANSTGRPPKWILEARESLLLLWAVGSWFYNQQELTSLLLLPFTWISKAVDPMPDMPVCHILLGTDQILVFDKVIGSMGVLESDVGMFPSHATNGLRVLGNSHIILWAIGFLPINQG